MLCLNNYNMSIQLREVYLLSKDTTSHGLNHNNMPTLQSPQRSPPPKGTTSHDLNDNNMPIVKSPVRNPLPI